MARGHAPCSLVLSERGALAGSGPAGRMGVTVSLKACMGLQPSMAVVSAVAVTEVLPVVEVLLVGEGSGPVPKEAEGVREDGLALRIRPTPPPGPNKSEKGDANGPALVAAGETGRADEECDREEDEEPRKSEAEPGLCWLPSAWG